MLAGEHDEIAPELGRALADGIENARLYEFDGASHLALWEVRRRHAEVVGEFLDGVS